MGKSTAIPTAAREAVYLRQRGRCLRCGTSPYSEVHHRMPRRIAGHGWENLVGLCMTCHHWVHANPRLAREHGWIVSRHSNIADIMTVPVDAWNGTQFLHPDGTLTVG